MGRLARMWIGVVCGVLTISGCSTPGAWWRGATGSGEEDLSTTVSAYCKYLNFREYDKAKAFILRPDRANYSRYFDTVRDRLQIESYRVDDAEIHENGEVPPGWDAAEAGEPPPARWARVIVSFKYVLLPSNTMQTSMLEQAWVATAGEWMLLFPAAGPGF